MPIFKKLALIFFVLFTTQVVWAEPWADHQSEIEELEREIYKFQQEMDVLVERKKNTRERARIEQTLQRIVEIHAELISLRKNMDSMRLHLKAEHPKQAHILDNYDSRMFKSKKDSKKYTISPLSRDLDQLLIKVQLKYSSFLRNENQKDEMIAVEKVLTKKRKKKREREADVYLRKRSKIKLVK